MRYTYKAIESMDEFFDIIKKNGEIDLYYVDEGKWTSIKMSNNKRYPINSYEALYEFIPKGRYCQREEQAPLTWHQFIDNLGIYIIKVDSRGEETRVFYLSACTVEYLKQQYKKYEFYKE